MTVCAGRGDGPPLQDGRCSPRLCAVWTRVGAKAPCPPQRTEVWAVGTSPGWAEHRRSPPASRRVCGYSRRHSVAVGDESRAGVSHRPGTPLSAAGRCRGGHGDHASWRDITLQPPQTSRGGLGRLNPLCNTPLCSTLGGRAAGTTPPHSPSGIWGREMAAGAHHETTRAKDGRGDSRSDSRSTPRTQAGLCRAAVGKRLLQVRARGPLGRRRRFW